MNDREVEHVRIARKMDELHRQSIMVSFGFIIFWILLGSAFVYAVWHFWVSAWIL